MGWTKILYCAKPSINGTMALEMVGIETY
jgi:hypothetical protein